MIITKRLPFVLALTALLTTGAVFADNHGPHNTSMFKGPKANTGMAVHTTEGGKGVLRVTPDFKVPDTPAPTWRVVDSSGRVFTLDAFKIQGGEKRQVTVPAYVKDIAKVQVYCAWAEVLLGEAAFTSPVK
jgi:hypothetical protein